MLGLLKGVVDTTTEQELIHLRTQNAILRERLEQIERENESVLVGVQQLRQILQPIHNGLKLIFGEIENLGGNTADDTSRQRQAYQQYLDSFGDNLQGKMIRALLDHGPMTAAQLRVPMACSQQSVYNTYDRLVKRGLVSSSGGKYHLKEL